MNEKQYNLLTNKRTNDNVIRKSGIELLKIIGIFLIILWHMTQTLNDTGYCYVSWATVDVQKLLLSFMSYCGMYGNLIFFISSSWFLLESNRVNVKKILFIIIKIWTVSVIMIIISYIVFYFYPSIAPVGQNKSLLISSLFPTLLGNNWYVTCYILFYPLHILLNKIIYSISKKQLLIFSVISFLLYSILSLLFSLVNIFLNYGSYYFFSSSLLQWCILYLCIGYIKLYMKNFCKNIKINKIIFLIGIFSGMLFILCIDFLGLKVSYAFEKKLWVGVVMGSNTITMMNPFVLLTIIPLFNIFNNMKFKRKKINYIAKFSLLIYVLHENIIFRKCFRPLIFKYINNEFGMDYILIWVIGVSIGLFFVCLILSILYDLTLMKLVKRCSDKIYQPLVKICNKVINKLMVIS